MSQHFEPEFKKRIVRLHLEEGRLLRSLAEECQHNEEVKAEYDYMKENLALKKQLPELQKEKDFLKKRRHSLLRKSIRGLLIHSTV